MKTRRTRPHLKNVLAALLAVATLLLGAAVSPAAAFAANTTADPDVLATPGPYDAADQGVESLIEQIESLQKIIDLNVKPAQKIPVLLYHHIVPASDIPASERDNDSILSLEQFTEQMKYLHTNGYYTASLWELERFVSGKLNLPEKTVVITFDDGYVSTTKYAYPVLKRFEFKAAVFLITSLIGAKDKENTLEHANWTELKRCSTVFTFQSHSHNLHSTDKDGVAAALTVNSEALMEDLLVSRAITGTFYLSYPFGQQNAMLRGAAKNAGYRMALTTSAAYAKIGGNLYSVSRFPIKPKMTIDDFVNICTLRTVGSDEKA